MEETNDEIHIFISVEFWSLLVVWSQHADRVIPSGAAEGYCLQLLSDSCSLRPAWESTVCRMALRWAGSRASATCSIEGFSLKGNSKRVIPEALSYVKELRKWILSGAKCKLYHLLGEQKLLNVARKQQGRSHSGGAELRVRFVVLKPAFRYCCCFPPLKSIWKVSGWVVAKEGNFRQSKN